MTKIPFCGQTYQDKTLNANAQDAINLYPMRTKDPQYSDKKISYALPDNIIMYPTPGYKWQTYLGTGPVRGFYVINNVLYIVSGQSLIVCTPIGGNNNLASAVFTTVGTLNTNSGPVSIECNTVQLAISDGQFGYTYTLASGVFAVISGGGWPGSVTNFCYIDGYILGAGTASKTVWQSDVLDATTFGAQAFDTITSFPDHINAVFSDELQLYIFGPKICEVQADAGSIPYAFQKVPNVLIQAGCVSWATLKKVANTFFFLASDVAGKAYIAALNSYDTKVISTPPINEAIERYATISDAYSWAYREGDNHFYCTTFPSAGVTWCYDIKMDMFHKRSINGGADLPTACVLWQGMQIVGDAQGSLYIMSQDYTTYGVYDFATKEVTDYPLERSRTAAHVNAEGKSMFINELWVDMQVGMGFVPDAQLASQPKAQPAIPTIVQQAGAPTGFTSIVVTLANPSASGNLLAAFIGTEIYNDLPHITGVTDDLGQVWKEASGSHAYEPINGNISDIWYFSGTKAGVTQITISFSSQNFNTGGAQVYEVAGCRISNAMDVAASLIGNQAAPFTSAPATPAITTTANNDFVLVGVSNSNPDGLSVAPPYRLNAAYNAFGGINSAASYVPPGTLAAQSATFAFNARPAYTASAAAFFAQPPVTPLATLYVSKDFGRTWRNAGTRSLGAIGQTRQRLVWRNLGRFRQNATFRLAVSDPVATYILGAKANIKVGNK